ncbi:uncharacterized protein [Chironomus tepperi]|uniref:uncharacterized protein n=1 Tax=Chironomus tepperi TaxID=113505 RepID=UPI00391F243E
MSFDLTEKLYYSKSLNTAKYFHRNYLFDLDDELVPQNLREALMSENSDPVPSQIVIFQNKLVNKSSSIELIKSNDNQADYITSLQSITRRGSDDVTNDRDKTDDESETWFPSRACPNGCNCGKCPIDKGIKPSQSVMSLVPSNSSTSMTLVPSNSNFFISITDVVPLRNNFGAIIHWSVLHYHGISGYKIFLDGNHVASVYSPSRTVALIDNVNMKFPHHIAVSIIKTGSVTFAAKSKSNKHQHRRNSTARQPKIMYGYPTRDGEFGWQASLELLHPSLGFIGHWCGGVLINKYWVVSSAHCVHNDLFNLPLPALWTVVLGENNRKVETGYEQRIPVDKIVMHEKYRHFKNDLVLMKLSRAANLSPKSGVRTIFLPSSSHTKINPTRNGPPPTKLTSIQWNDNDDNLLNLDRNENYLRKLDSSSNVKSLMDKIKKVNRNEIARKESPKTKLRSDDASSANKTKIMSSSKFTRNSTSIPKKNHRRNDKFLHRRPTNPEDYELFMSAKDKQPTSSSIDYYDCWTVGWGKWMERGDLSDVLLKIDVPIHNMQQCDDVYSGYVSLNNAQHLCAGRLDGTGGSCIGDSGGGLQCKLDKNGPWILVGITSFGSGCAKEGYADVFTNVAYYRNWIDNVIRNN